MFQKTTFDKLESLLRQVTGRYSHNYLRNLLDEHHFMLSDKIRVTKYKEAIEERVGKNDVVLDVGTGTGVLSFFAAKKTSNKVYAVDNSFIIKIARKIATANKLENIVFIHSDIKKTSIPKVDCVISEVIGKYVIEEGIIEKMRFVKSKFLKKNGKLIPHKIEFIVYPVEINEFQFFWEKRYGLDFSILQKKLSETVMNGLKLTKKSRILSDSRLVYSLDFSHLPKKFSAQKIFRITKNGRLNGFCMIFVIHLTEKIKIDVRDYDTEWTPLIFPTLDEINVKKGDLIKFNFWTTKNNTEWNWSYKIL